VKDALRRLQTIANLTLVPFNTLRLGIRSGYYNTWNQIPGGGIIGNSIYGTYALAGYARPELANCNKSTYVAPAQCSGPGNPFGNGAFMSIRESLQQITEEQVNRTTGAANATGRPTMNCPSTSRPGGTSTTGQFFVLRFPSTSTNTHRQCEAPQRRAANTRSRDTRHQGVVEPAACHPFHRRWWRVAGVQRSLGHVIGRR
jgi:hypothetical protein